MINILKFEYRRLNKAPVINIIPDKSSTTVRIDNKKGT